MIKIKFRAGQLAGSLLSLLFCFAAADICTSAASAAASASYICRNTTTGALTIRNKCKRGEVKLSNVSSLVGPPGSAGSNGANGATGPAGTNGVDGATGADGQLRIYGNGSAGALVVSSSGSLFAGFANNNNLQFSSIDIQTGRILTVPGGTVLRASGDVTIAGTITVDPQNYGGVLESASGAFASGVTPAMVSPAAGVSSRIAGIGAIGSNSVTLYGGQRGAGASLGTNNVVSDRLLMGGGSGAPASLNVTAGSGGGSIMIIAGGSITVTGTGAINANGGTGPASYGAGGGAGGIIVLGAKTAITNNGTITAQGGNGGQGGIDSASGGGGGGGIIVLASPAISGADNTSVAGGTGGASKSAGTITASPRIGGGGGGGCGGAGGLGADANTDGSCTAGGNGSSGVTKTIPADPAALF